LEWIQSLKEGDLIDCIKNDPHYKKCCWSYARIASVMDTHLKVSFLYERESSNRYILICKKIKLNRYIEKVGHAHEIAPQGTKCTDFDWRLSIKVGDIIDACDTTSVWYHSTVMQERESMIDEQKSIREIYIGRITLRFFIK
jgi:hypothetical protein